MNRKTWCAALAALSGVALWTSSARATEDDDGVTEPPTWLLGIGVSVGSFGIGSGGIGAAGVGSAAGLLPAMLYSTGLERRLTDSLWLTGQFRGGFDSFETEGAWPAESMSYAVNGQLGLRHAFNPGDRVQLSLLTSLGAFYGRNRYQLLTTDELGDPVAIDDEGRTWGVHLDAGMAVDFWLTEQLALRVGTRIFTAGHQRTSQGADSQAWFAELGLSPSVGLQIGF